jgi:hypothetical protein
MEDPERPVPVDPPEDPESWTDEQWIAWLEATDDPDVQSGPGGNRPHRWRTRLPGSMLGAAMLGLRDAIYGRPQDEIVIVADAGGDPPGDDLPEVHLDPDHPERSEVIVRRGRPSGEPEPPPSAHEP